VTKRTFLRLRMSAFSTPAGAKFVIGIAMAIIAIFGIAV